MRATRWRDRVDGCPARQTLQACTSPSVVVLCSSHSGTRRCSRLYCLKFGFVSTCRAHADVMHEDLCFCTLRTAPPFRNSHGGSWPGSLQEFWCGASRDTRASRRDDISFSLSCVHPAQTVQTGGDGRLKRERCLASPSALQLCKFGRGFPRVQAGKSPLTPCSTRACLCFVCTPPPSTEKIKQKIKHLQPRAQPSLTRPKSPATHDMGRSIQRPPRL